MTKTFCTSEHFSMANQRFAGNVVFKRPEKCGNMVYVHNVFVHSQCSYVRSALRGDVMFYRDDLEPCAVQVTKASMCTPELGWRSSEDKTIRLLSSSEHSEVSGCRLHVLLSHHQKSRSADGLQFSFKMIPPFYFIFFN